MRQTLRQIVAVLALGGIALSLVPNALAATYTDLAAANKLASMNVIVDQSATPAEYRLGDTLLRQEGVGTAAKALGIIPDAPVSDYTCMNKFSDVSEAWVCRAAELSAKTGLTNASNTTFRPKDNLTKYEAMLFALRGSCIVPVDRTPTGVAAFAAEAGIISNAASFNATAAATRGEFFRYVATAHDESECGDTSDEDVLCALFPSLCVDEDTDPTDPSTGDVKVSLSNESPAGRTLPHGANGVWVASYVVTASEDTVVSALKLKREGVSADADVTNFTALANGARVSDSKDENSDDEVTLTLKSGGVAIDAGESVVFDILVDIPSVGPATVGAEIIVSLVEITAGGDVSGLPIRAGKFTVGSAAAPSIEVTADGSVSAPELGQIGADLFRLKVKNNNSSNETVSLDSITFEQTGTIDENTELMNYKLLKGTQVLASVASTDSKYVTFMLSTPLEITQGNNVSLKVVADVIGGAAKTVVFGIDQKLDVSASSSKYGNGVSVVIAPDLDSNTVGNQQTFAPVTVKAGAVNLVKIDAPADKIREDKDDVVLGSLDIIAAQSDLEVKKIAFAITATGGDNVDALLENVQLRNTKTGARYDLNASVSAAGMEFSDSSFDFSLAMGSNKFDVIADTLNSIVAFDTNTLTLSMVADTNTAGTNGYLVIEETADDTVVTDITPSSLTWKKVDGSETGASVSVLPLSDLIRVRGATNITAMQIEIKADESSSLSLDELKAYIDANGSDATNQMVSQVSLYEGTDTSGTPLDSVSGSNLSSGVATFDGFDIMIPANGKKAFTITLSFVDGVAASTGSDYHVEIDSTDVSLQDDQNDDVALTAATYTSARDITITNVGELILTADANNIDNQEVKSVLGGSTTVVFSADIQAINESVDVEKVVFNYTGGNLKTASARAELWLGNTMIATAPNADIAAGTITFGGTNAGELTSLIIPQESKELRLAIISETIGYEKAGLVAKNVDITSITIATTDASGVSSGRDITGAINVNVAASSALFSVVPTIVTPSVVSALSASSATAKIKLTANSGSNTVNASSSKPTVGVNTLTFSAPGASGVIASDYVLYEEGKSGVQVIGQLVGGNVVFDFADSNGDGDTVDVGDAFANGTFTTDKTYVIVPTMGAGDTASLTLLKTGVAYGVDVTNATGLTTTLPNELEFGTRTINN